MFFFLFQSRALASHVHIPKQWTMELLVEGAFQSKGDGDVRSCCCLAKEKKQKSPSSSCRLDPACHIVSVPWTGDWRPIAADEGREGRDRNKEQGVISSWAQGRFEKQQQISNDLPLPFVFYLLCGLS